MHVMSKSPLEREHTMTRSKRSGTSSSRSQVGRQPRLPTRLGGSGRDRVGQRRAAQLRP
jgi:ribosomal protein L4